MPLATDAAGLVWLEPRHISLNDIDAELCAGSIDTVTAKFALTPAEWREVAEGLSQQQRKNRAVDPALLMASVNVALAPHALVLPSYSTYRQAKLLDDLLYQPVPDVGEAQKLIERVAMGTRIRAHQLVGRFMKLPPFKEFAYLIDAATLCYFRGNMPSAFLSLVPVIEGVLLRWQGYPAPGVNKPSFATTKTFISATATREPFPSLPQFFDSWASGAENIINTQLFRNTAVGPVVDHFNRHLALHLLEDVSFGSRENVTRLFVLIDVLSDLYVCEKKILDPRFATTREEEAAHIEAYTRALASQDVVTQPERILAKTHARCQ